MAIKINRKLLPVKAHFFFFFAALGPILPQLNMFGRQLGVSPAAMGFVTAGLPLLWALAKPAAGYLVDYWPAYRKFVFMLLIITMTGSYCGLWFIPVPEVAPVPTEMVEQDNLTEYVYQINDTVYLKKYDSKEAEFVEKFQCHWSCFKGNIFEVYLTNTTYVNTIFIDKVDNNSCADMKMDYDSERYGDITCSPKKDCNLLCFEDINLINMTALKKTKRAVDNANIDNNIDKIYVKTNIEGSDAVYTTESIKGTDNNKVESLKNYANEKCNKSLGTVAQVSQPAITTEITNNKEISLDATNNADIKTNGDSIDVETKCDIKTEDDQIKSVDISKEVIGAKDIRAKVSKVVNPGFEGDESSSYYVTGAFWSFVVLMCVGTVAFNVANCIGDAVCFDVLVTKWSYELLTGPDGGSAYGAQRAWGTAGYGATALLGGWLVDRASAGAGAGGRKDFTPAFLLALAATAADLLSCRKLKLPALSSPADSGKALRAVLRLPRMLVFIAFAVLAGLFDSFIIYYMFWFLEDLAEQTGHQTQIKLIEGIVIAAQSFIGEIVFFALSGRIIKRWGYGTTMTLSLFCYGVRMALISLIQNPWQLIPLEAIMQGPTYALCYSCVVGYAAAAAPEGYSATVQGIVAGMDDGLGFALGSLAGGQLFARAGGRGAFRVLAAAAGAAALGHAALGALLRTHRHPGTAVAPPSAPLEEGEKMLAEPRALPAAAAIYRDTVVPLAEKSDR